MNGMRKIGKSANKSKPVEEEEELDFDKDIEDALKEEQKIEKIVEKPLVDIKISDEILMKPVEEMEIPNEDELASVSAENENPVDHSVYVKNVDFAANPEDLEEHFKTCGIINRITILIDKYTGKPKGYAFIEFATSEAKEKAKSLNDSLLIGRQIKVVDKRKNIPEYFGKKVKHMNNPVFLYNKGHHNVHFGPMKGKFIPSKNFNPY